MNISPNSMFVGQAHLHLEEVDSTNEEMKKLALKSKLIEGLILTTDFQSKGKGQLGRQWVGERGKNAMFSAYLKPKYLKKSDLQCLSCVVALGVRAAVQKFVPNKTVQVKWPNDILIEGKKVCGILIENTISAETTSIVGIGINVNQTSFPSTLSATSLKLAAGQALEIASVIEECCTYIEQYYRLSNENNGMQQIRQLYVSQLYMLDETVKVNQEPFVVRSLDEQGRLVLQGASETLHLMHNEREVKWS